MELRSARSAAADVPDLPPCSRPGSSSDPPAFGGPEQDAPTALNQRSRAIAEQMMVGNTVDLDPALPRIKNKLRDSYVYATDDPGEV